MTERACRPKCSYLFFPNFMVLIWAPGWYITYHYWPTAYNRHIFEGTLYFVPAKNARDRLRQELAAVTFKEFGLQDCNTLEATQTMLESRAVSTSRSTTKKSSSGTCTRRGASTSLSTRSSVTRHTWPAGST